MSTADIVIGIIILLICVGLFLKFGRSTPAAAPAAKPAEAPAAQVEALAAKVEASAAQVEASAAQGEALAAKVAEAPAAKVAEAPAAKVAEAPAAQVTGIPATEIASFPATEIAEVTPVDPPSAPVGITVDWIKKDNVAHYLGDSQYGAKTITSTTGTVDKCKTDCNNTPNCTHFNYMGDSCTLFSGGEWVGTHPGSQSYCKAQCQT
jgi:hypothetical protein